MNFRFAQKWKLLLSSALVFALIATACSSGAAETAVAGEQEERETDSEVGTDTDGDGESEETETDALDPVDIVAAWPAPVFEPGACEFTVLEGYVADCGWVEVPQQWSDTSDPDTIRLHVATFTNDQTPAEAAPVVYLEGGPGGDAFFGLEFNLGEQWGELINQHPLVVFTQRGSALSDVDLECEEVVDETLIALESAPDVEAETAASLAALEACAARLISEGADFTAYNTVASANDADAVRRALSLESWNVFGISYGTRLGQELARNFPDTIDSLILDSVQPTDPALGSLAAVPTTFQGSLERFFAGCEADQSCAERYPDLENRFFTVIDAAGATPFEVEGLDPLSGEPFNAVIDDSRLARVVFSALYSPTSFGAVPALIEELEAGETTILSSFVGIQVVNSSALSTGHYSAVICHDYTAELTPDSAYDDGLTGDPFFDETFAGVDAVSVAADTCGAFPSGSANASVTEAVQSDIPTLIMSGEYDPITPPSFAEAIAPGFSNGQNVVLPNEGHAVTTSECGLSIALDFIASPTSSVDQSCIESSPTPPFVAPSLEGTVMVPFDEPLLGISGVRPEGWISQGFGSFVRDDANFADQLVLLEQAAPVPPAQFLGLFEAQLDTVFVEVDEVTSGDRTWTIYEAESLLGDVRVWTHEAAANTLAVALIGNDATFDDATEHVISEVLLNLQ